MREEVEMITSGSASPVEPATSVEARLALAIEGEVLESPVWDEAEGRLALVDILRGRAHLFDPRTGLASTLNLGAPIGALLRRRSGGWSAAVGDSLRGLGDDGPGGASLAHVDGAPGFRFNDVKTGPGGAVWAGWMTDARTGEGELLRIEPGRGTEVVESAIGLPNGMGWTVSGTEMYFIDSLERRIDRYAFDPVGGIRGGRVGAIDLSDAPGLPDGMTVDAEDHVWVALWGGSEVRRYSPEGRHEATVSLPVSQVSSCEFGGPELLDLYITTARYAMDEAALLREPLAGALFVARPGVAGQPSRKHIG